MRCTPRRAERKGTSRSVSEAGSTNCSPGPRCHSRARVVCSDCSAHLPVPPSVAIPASLPVIARALPHAALELPHRPAHAIALPVPGWTTAGEPHSLCLQASSHCCSTRTKTESKLHKTVIALPTLAVISCSLCQFVPSIYFLLCVD